MANVKRSDVVIVGAGPAGSSAAYFLARSGVRVTLLDKETFPRDKVCGDGISASSLRQLDRMGLGGRLDAEGAHAPSGIRLGAPNGDIAVVGASHCDERDYIFGRIMPRRKLDVVLIQAAVEAGAEFLDGVRAAGMSSEGGSADVYVMNNGKRETLRGHVVIAADGTRGGFSSRIGLQSGPLLCVAARMYVTGDDHSEGLLDMLFEPDIVPCYGWVFPVGDGMYNVGMGMTIEYAGRRSLIERLETFLRTNPRVLRRLSNCQVVGKPRGFGLYAGFRPSQVYRERLLVAGDAAGLVSPLTGAGISRALISGEVAARHARSALMNGDCSANGLAAYARELGARFGRQHALRRFVQRLFGHEYILNRVVHLLGHDEAFGRLAHAILADTADYSDLLRPRMLVKFFA